MDPHSRTDLERAAIAEQRRSSVSRRRFFMPDMLAHFKNDKPGWRLAALTVMMLPAILATVAMIVR